MGVILAEPAHSRTNSRTTARAAPHARGRARDRRWTRAPDDNARPVMPARRPHRLALSAAVTTPGSVTVHRSYKDITVACEAAGQPAGSMAVKSSTKAMAFGNVIAGGVIGAGIDMANGAAYDYPDLLTVTMGRVDGPPSAPPAPAAPAAIVPAQAAAPAPAAALPRRSRVRRREAADPLRRAALLLQPEAQQAHDREVGQARRHRRAAEPAGADLARHLAERRGERRIALARVLHVHHRGDRRDERSAAMPPVAGGERGVALQDRVFTVPRRGRRGSSSRSATPAPAATEARRIPGPGTQTPASARTCAAALRASASRL
jgi:hypothetical protein